jgi:hypothetical protein
VGVLCALLLGCGGAGPTPLVIFVTPAPAPTATAGGGVEITPGAVITAEPVTPATTVAGAAQVTITKTSLVRWINAIDNPSYQLVLEVTNSGGGWADLYASSDYTVFAADGSVTTTDTIYYGFPRYLGPGQKGYLLGEGSGDGGKLTDYTKVDVSLVYNEVDGPGDELTVSNTKIKSGYFGDGVDVTGIVKNTSALPASSSVVAAILFDSSGKTLGFNWTIVDDIGAGKSKGFVLSGGRDLKLSSVAKAVLFAYSTD